MLMKDSQTGQLSSVNRLRRDGRVVEGARLESVYRGNSIEGSNPSLSARIASVTYSGRFCEIPWSAAAAGGGVAEAAGHVSTGDGGGGSQR